jgi:hypothetical protein
MHEPTSVPTIVPRKWWARRKRAFAHPAQLQDADARHRAGHDEPTFPSWPGLVPAIHVFAASAFKTWMPGTGPGTTNQPFRHGRAWSRPSTSFLLQRSRRGCPAQGRARRTSLSVMAGLGPGHPRLLASAFKTWMPGTGPGMTNQPFRAGMTISAAPAAPAAGLASWRPCLRLRRPCGRCCSICRF